MGKTKTAGAKDLNALVLKIVPMVFLLLTAISPFASAQTYFVSNDGSNANNGLSPGASFQTLAHAAGIVSSGDTILLKRGDVFYESVSLGPSNIHVDAYGPAEQDLPVVSGGTVINNWQPYSGSIYVADVTANIGYLTVDGNHMNIARYPNTGWLRTTTWTENPDGSNTVVTCNGLASHPANANDYWNGANMRWHRHSWWFETRKVLDYDASGMLYLDGQSIIPVQPWNKDGWGFYLDNMLQELDAPGEYYYDPGANKVYLYALSGADPNNLLVEGSTRSMGLSVSSSTVKNIAFRHQTSYGLQITGTTIVEQCRFEHIGDDTGGAGLRATWSVHNAQIRNNLFQNNYNAAIDWNENPSGGGSSVIEYNTLINSGTVGGYGGQGPWKAPGIVIPNSTNLHVQYNHINGTGYAGIIFGSNGNYAEYNVIDNAMSTLNDGAAIYTNCSYSTFRYNIIRDTRGGMESSGPWANLAHGIWPEFLSEFRENVIENNTIVNSGGFGIFLENNFDCILRNNTIFGCDRASFWLAEMNPNPQGHVIEDNIFYSDYQNGRTLLFTKGVDFGSMNNNYFCNPYTDYHMTPANSSWQWDPPITIANWQVSYPSWADPSAKTDLQKLMSVPAPGEPGYSDIFVNEAETIQSVPVNGVWRDLEGNLVHTCIELEPFSSRILIVFSLLNADLNGDCTLNWADLAIFTASWLKQQGDPDYNQDADFDSDGIVNFIDYSTFAEQL